MLVLLLAVSGCQGSSTGVVSEAGIASSNIATATPTNTPTPTTTPTPIPTSTATPMPARYNPPVVSAQGMFRPSVERWRNLVATIWPPEAVDKVLRIMTCESGGDTNVVGIGGTGLMQINDIHGPYDWTDPITNLTKAYALSRGGTQWWHWDGPTPGRGQAWADGAICGWQP